MQDTVLILSERSYGLDEVVAECQRRGYAVLIVSNQSLVSEGAVSLGISSSSIHGKISLRGRDVDLGRIRAAWVRMMWPLQTQLSLSGAPTEAQFFLNAEWQQMINGLWAILDNCRWISPPDRISTASYKPFQLELARKVGLQIPPTLMTNDPGAALEFASGDPSNTVVFKAFRTGLAGLDPDNEGHFLAVYARKVQITNLVNAQLLRTSPCIFQREVRKLVDLRVIVIGSEVIPVAIESPDSASPVVDVRRYESSPKCYRHPLPSEVAEKCLTLVRMLGLSYAAIDFIVTPEMEYVFLELNPTGEFGYYCSEAGVNVIPLLVDTLIGDVEGNGAP